MTRIDLEDTAMSAVMKMAEGNPGAAMAMMEIIEKHEDIDPQAAFGGFGTIMLLDTWGVYGTDIYVLFNDKCDRSVRKMLILIRATQLGIYPQSELTKLANDQSRQINLTQEEWESLDMAVCEQLDKFAKSELMGIDG